MDGHALRLLALRNDLHVARQPPFFAAVVEMHGLGPERIAHLGEPVGLAVGAVDRPIAPVAGLVLDGSPMFVVAKNADLTRAPDVAARMGGRSCRPGARRRLSPSRNRSDSARGQLRDFEDPASPRARRWRPCHSCRGRGCREPSRVGREGATASTCRCPAARSASGHDRASIPAA